MAKKKIKLTTTKKVLWLSWILFIALIVMNVCGLETGTALEIVGGIVTSIVTSLYLWKSKCENKEKIAFDTINKLAEEYGIENAIEIIRVIVEE